MQNYNSKFKIIFLFFTFYFLFFALMAQADDGLVPCKPGECNFCHLPILVGKVVHFAVYFIAVPLVVAFIAWGGLKIMTAGDNTEKVQEGRKAVQAAVIGLLIAVGAWLIVNTILSTITTGKIKPWKFSYDETTICDKEQAPTK